MSVVNKMLKDLENREATQAAPANYQPPVKTSSSLLRISLILVVGAAAFSVVYFWPTTSHSSLPEASSVEPINLVGEQAAARQTAAPAESERLQAVQIDPTQGDKPRNTMGSMNGPFKPKPPSAPDEQEVTEAGPSASQRIASYTAEAVGNITNETPDIPAPEPEKHNAQPVIKPSSANPESALKAQIRQAISQNDTPTAIQLLRTLIGQQPDNVAARKRLAALYFSAGRTTDAQQLLQKSVADMPADNSVRLMYARLLVQQNETKLAYYALLDVNDFGQPSIELLGYRASLAQKLSLLDEALTDYAQLTKLDSQTARWWLGQAVVADKQGYTALALNSYREALGLHQLDAGIEQFIRQRLTNLAGDQS